MMNETDTRAKLIDPALYAAGWDHRTIFREVQTGLGRADYVLQDEHGILAIVEAKAEYHAAEDGLQQAKAGAAGLNAPFAIATNGHGILFLEVGWSPVQRLDLFPGPRELRRMVEGRQSPVKAADAEANAERLAQAAHAKATRVCSYLFHLLDQLARKDPAQARQAEDDLSVSVGLARAFYAEMIPGDPAVITTVRRACQSLIRFWHVCDATHVGHEIVALVDPNTNAVPILTPAIGRSAQPGYIHVP
jgi:hypothetical protein